MAYFCMPIDYIAQSTSSFFSGMAVRLDVGITDEARVYIASLFTRFTQAAEVFSGVGEGYPTLVDFLSRANDAGEPERSFILRHVGDLSLFLSGFFPESLPVPKTYYVSVGGGAYVEASASSKNVAPVLEELGQQFEPVVDSISEYRSKLTPDISIL